MTIKVFGQQSKNKETNWFVSWSEGSLLHAAAVVEFILRLARTIRCQERMHLLFVGTPHRANEAPNSTCYRQICKLTEQRDRKDVGLALRAAVPDPCILTMA
eukprot:10246-Amphidinium_carterae.2